MNPAVTPVGRLLEDYLVRNGLTQKKFAKSVQISPPYLSMMMKGERPVTPHIASLLAEETGIPIHRWQQERAHRGTPSSDSGTVLADWRIIKAERDGLLKISPFRFEGEDNRVQAASYDLSRGYFKFPDGGWRRDKDQLVLKSGCSVLVKSREKITLSNRVIGRIAPQSDLVMHFVVLSFGLHLDPGWEGQPFMHLHNHGEDPLVLDYDQRFASVEFHLLADEPNTAWSPDKSPALN